MQTVLNERLTTGILGAGGALKDYWLRPGGEISLGVVRIAVFAAVLHSHHLNFSSAEAAGQFARAMTSANYVPKGIIKGLGGLPFTPGFAEAVWWIGTVAAILAIIGLATRASMIVATLASLTLISFKESFGPYWSHPYNVVMLSALVVMASPAGASLSVDRALGRLTPFWPFGRTRPDEPCYWPVLAAQLAVAFFYFGAFWAKLVNGGIYWAIGDNMRWMIAITWSHPYAEHEQTALIRALLGSSWLWQAAAIVHLVTQFLPITAAFLIHRPVLRLLEAGVYVSGVFGLYHVMTVWNPQWLWLAAVFVDWEWLAARTGAAGSTTLRHLVPDSYEPGRHGGDPPAPREGHALAPVSVIGFGVSAATLLYCAATFTFQLAHRHLNYPFSSFDFYSTVYTLPPYGQHRHHTFMAGGVRLRGDCASFGNVISNGVPLLACKDGVAELNRRAKPLSSLFDGYRLTAPDDVARALNGIRAHLDSFEGLVPAATRLELLVRLWQYPPYPAPATPIVSHQALRGVRLEDGRTLSAYGEVFVVDQVHPSIRTHVSGFRDPVINLKFADDPSNTFGAPTLRDLPGSWMAPDVFRIDIDRFRWPAHIIVEVREREGGEEFAFWGPFFHTWYIARERTPRR